jgi:hypothetical protein
VAALRIANHMDVTPKKDFVETEEDQRALDQASERRAAFNFKMVDIAPGAILTFTRDPNITCTVVDERKVNFEGENVSLSVAADRALRRVGVTWKSVQGPLYWEFENETLDERRARMEEGNGSD